MTDQLQQQLEYTLLKSDCHSWWISKMQSDSLEEQYAIKFCFKLGKKPQKCMECFRLLFDHLTWVEHQFLSGIRNSRKAGCLWGMTRGVGGEFRKRFHRKRSTLFKSGQWHFYQDNTPVYNFLLVTDYLTKIGIKTFAHPPYSPDLSPCNFWLFPNDQ